MADRGDDVTGGSEDAFYQLGIALGLGPVEAAQAHPADLATTAAHKLQQDPAPDTEGRVEECECYVVGLSTVYINCPIHGAGDVPSPEERLQEIQSDADTEGREERVANSSEVLRQIVNHFQEYRGVGHTATVVEGASVTGAVVVTHTGAFGRTLACRHGIETISIGGIARGGLRGRSSPLVVDNEVFRRLASEVLEENAALRARIEELEGALEKMMDGTDCRLDHHGLCQAHGWNDDGDCPERRARKALEADDKIENTGKGGERD